MACSQSRSRCDSDEGLLTFFDAGVEELPRSSSVSCSWGRYAAYVAKLTTPALSAHQRRALSIAWGAPLLVATLTAIAFASPPLAVAGGARAAAGRARAGDRGKAGR
jgi:hypothetical protein